MYTVLCWQNKRLTTWLMWSCPTKHFFSSPQCFDCSCLFLCKHHKPSSYSLNLVVALQRCNSPCTTHRKAPQRILAQNLVFKKKKKNKNYIYIYIVAKSYGVFTLCLNEHPVFQAHGAQVALWETWPCWWLHQDQSLSVVVLICFDVVAHVFFVSVFWWVYMCCFFLQFYSRFLPCFW